MATADTYNRHVNDPEVLAQTYEGFVARMIWVSSTASYLVFDTLVSLLVCVGGG